MWFWRLCDRCCQWWTAVWAWVLRRVCGDTVPYIAGWDARWVNHQWNFLCHTRLSVVGSNKTRWPLLPLLMSLGHQVLVLSLWFVPPLLVPYFVFVDTLLEPFLVGPLYCWALRYCGVAVLQHNLQSLGSSRLPSLPHQHVAYENRLFTYRLLYPRPWHVQLLWGNQHSLLHLWEVIMCWLTGFMWTCIS